jgi:acetyltransferase-like isoleucine patch superfamily enzyme
MNTNKNKDYISHGDGSYSLSDFKRVGYNVIIEKDVKVFHPENIILGDNIYVGHNSILKGYHKNEMVIGNNTWIGQNCYFHSGGGLEIGEAIGIGPDVKILSSSHMDNNINKPVLFHPLIFEKVVLKNGCDIGIGTIILPGVIIGEGVIIGAGAVVVESIPDYCVAVGVPARVIRERK